MRYVLTLALALGSYALGVHDAKTASKPECPATATALMVRA